MPTVNKVVLAAVLLALTVAELATATRESRTHRAAELAVSSAPEVHASARD